MKRSFPALLGLLLASGAADAAGSQIYSASTPSAVFLLQWTDAGGQLRGSAQVVAVSPSPRDIGLTVVNSALSGTHAGNDYSLAFEKTIFGEGVTSAPATLDGGRLSINIPSQSGGLTTILLTKSSLADFNIAVSKLKVSAAAKYVDLKRKKDEADKLKAEADRKTVEAQDKAVAAGKIEDAASQTDRLLSSLRTSLADAQKVRLADARKLKLIISQITADAEQTKLLDQAQKCSDVLKAIDTLLGHVDTYYVLNNQLVETNEEAQKLLAALSNTLSSYQSALSNLTDFSPTRAALYQQKSGILVSGAERLLITTRASLLEAQDLEAAGAKARDNSEAVVANIVCK